VERELWIFGYGSLVWRPGFDHAERHPARVDGWARRFWQGSTDHRGVPDAPGRVATLVQDAGAFCWGVAYRVAPAESGTVLAALDHRERGGFDRVRVRARIAARPEPVDALTYVAGQANPNYLGPAPLAEIAAQVCRARGPSGENREYVLRLAEALRAQGADDEHVFALAALVEAGRAA